MKKREDRIQKLVELLEQTEKIHLKEAAKRLAVSEMTLRRDISLLDPSPLNLLGGYIILAGDQKRSTNYFLSDQQQRHIDEKRYIGELAVSLVAENDVIFFDCGTTMPFIIERIPNTLPFTAVCYSLNVFLALQQKENCKVILCGGEFSADNAIFVPINAHSPLDLICPTKSFISAAGISTRGVTCFNFHEANWKMKAIERSQQNILIADSSKFDEQRPAYFGQLDDFDILISDAIPDSYRTYCRNHYVTVVI
ncbi:DNA-binding transcriptional repressor DeoR [Utexia brackfieldae]|uniref:DNA-binding transcriptional repressor DeoR n=1 Tax=Utexia brackfieldae TaxID=3074108 RepID=UPI00370D0A4F